MKASIKNLKYSKTSLIINENINKEIKEKIKNNFQKQINKIMLEFVQIEEIIKNKKNEILSKINKKIYEMNKYNFKNESQILELDNFDLINNFNENLNELLSKILIITSDKITIGNFYNKKIDNNEIKNPININNINKIIETELKLDSSFKNINTPKNNKQIKTNKYFYNSIINGNYFNKLKNDKKSETRNNSKIKYELKIDCKISNKKYSLNNNLFNEIKSSKNNILTKERHSNYSLYCKKNLNSKRTTETEKNINVKNSYSNFMNKKINYNKFNWESNSNNLRNSKIKKKKEECENMFN